MDLDILNPGFVFDINRSNRFFKLIKNRTICTIIAAKSEQIFIETVAKLLMRIVRIWQNDCNF